MIDSRLKAIADMIDATGGGENAVIADVGSDHAYLPVWLCQNKKIKKAFASDISVNSFKKIKKNILRYNISPEIIVPVLSDGLAVFDDNFYGRDEITHIIIAGMGGNNIAQIINTSEIAKRKRLIFQPNTKVEFLRKFLYRNNFIITDETLAVDNGRIYAIISAKYNTGNFKPPEILDIIIGRYIREKKPEGYREYVDRQIKRFRNILSDLSGIQSEHHEQKQTEYGNYGDIENLIAELEKL